MDWTEALAIIAPSHPRYRWLCSEDNPDAESRAAYRRLLIREAGGEAPEPAPPEAPPVPPAVPLGPPAVPLAESLAVLNEARRCPFRTRPGCGCQPDRCTAGLGRHGAVTLDDCRRCLGPGGMWRRLFPVLP